jgi:hypothetical protein
VAEGGLPIPDDKVAVPKAVFGKLLALAFSPPGDLMRLPFTATQPRPTECFVSLLLRPVVCPEVPGYSPEKSMEVRFFAPGNLVSNLDFVESIFGNGGDPDLPERDAALDPEHWTGHTGCVVLAPHLIKVTKKAAGLAHWDELVIESWTVGAGGGAEQLYQQGALGMLLSAEQVLTLVRSRMPDGCMDGLVIFCGTVPIVGGRTIHGSRFRSRLRDAKLNRHIGCAYAVRRLDYLATDSGRGGSA